MNPILIRKTSLAGIREGKFQRLHAVMPKLYPALESRSADELTPGEELQALGNERGCSPGDVNRSPMQQAMHGHPPRDVSAQQHGRRREVAVTVVPCHAIFLSKNDMESTSVGYRNVGDNGGIQQLLHKWLQVLGRWHTIGLML